MTKTDSEHESEQSATGFHLGAKWEAILAASCGLALLMGWLTHWVTEELLPISLTFFLISYAAGGFPTLLETIKALKKFQFEIDLLMLVAAIGAAALGKWAEGALLLFLFSLAHSLEHLAMGRAKKAIESLAALAPKTALIREGETLRTIAVEQLQIGDVIVVKPNTRIAADGFVFSGHSEVDQSPITGESIPVGKTAVEDVAAAAREPEKLSAENRVFAGTINASGSLEVQVTRITGDSTLSRVVKMVNEAKTKRSPTQHFTQRFEKWFVPSVLLVVTLLLFAWLVVDETAADSFYRAMAFMVGASPCALAISTPSAVLSGIARAARGGVLVKGGGPLETLGQVHAIAFDKTGTLTEGKPHLSDVVCFDQVSISELLTTAISVERLSDHPLARAVVHDGLTKLQAEGAGDVPEASDLRNLVGQGVTAVVTGKKVYVGKAAVVEQVTGRALSEADQQKIEQLAEAGRTTIVVVADQRPLGVLGVMDTPRDSARPVMSALKKIGVERLIMISGDNQTVARAVGDAVGIDEARGELMPEDKVHVVADLQRHGDVAMIGDGVNDAPAMARASIGIAMGAAGSDVALETADVALMADDLTRLPFAVGLSRATARIIRQNLWISLGMVALLVPATILGLPMAPAVVFHEGSTLVVVLNALRLLGYPDPPAKTESRQVPV